MKFLIVYGTTEGQTRKISRYMEEVLKEAGHQVTISDASDEPPSPKDFDAIFIGASIHMHKYQSVVEHYVQRNLAVLNTLPGAFFSVCLAIASDIEEEHQEAENITREFLAKTGWKPVTTTQVAGALKYLEYDFFKRLIMKSISKKEGRSTDTSKDYEYTDWTAVRKFVLEFANKVTPPVPSS